MADTSIQWNNDINYLDISALKVESAQNASVSGTGIVFTNTGYITFSQHWEFTGDASKFNTGNMRLSLSISNNVEITTPHWSGVIASIVVSYWIKGEESYFESKQTVYSIPMSPTSAASTFDVSKIIQTDESNYVASLKVTFRCVEYLGQSLTNIKLIRAVSLNDNILSQVNSSLSNQQLYKITFGENGFISTYKNGVSEYRYLVDKSNIVGLVHQPSGFTIYIEFVEGDLPSGN